jgi:hypothetical protein
MCGARLNCRVFQKMVLAQGTNDRSGSLVFHPAQRRLDFTHSTTSKRPGGANRRLI